MMHLSIRVPILLLSAAVVTLNMAGCQQATEAEPAASPTSLAVAESQALAISASPAIWPTPTASATAPPSPTATAMATWTPKPTATGTPTLTHTPTTTAPPTGTAPPSATPLPQAESCPAEAPARPDYRYYYLDSAPWPTPLPNGSSDHFWLSKPLPGGGRLITNQWFPYGFNAYRYLLHNGTDVAEELGMPVLAAAAGRIVVAGSDENELWGWRCNWYGNLVVLELADRWLGKPVFVLYGHVLNIQVEPGQMVTRGQQLAEIGFGGAASVPHLHLEVRVGENDFASTRNPMLWFAPATRGVIAGRLVDPEGRPWQGVGISAVEIGGDGEIINTWSYLDDPLSLINPDEELAENFVFSDLRPGDYQLFIRLQGVEYTVTVAVIAGTVATVEIVTEPFKTPTPTAAATEAGS